MTLPEQQSARHPRPILSLHLGLKGGAPPPQSWDMQPTHIVGFSPVVVSCAPSSIMLLLNTNAR